MTPGDDDWRGSNPIEPPGLLQAAKHGSVDTWKWDESLSRDRAAGQDDNGIVGLDLGRIDERRVARFEWIAKDIAKNPAVERDDQTEGDEEKFSCPAPAPKDQDHQQHEHPRHGREDQCFEELLEDKHAPLVVQCLSVELGRESQEEKQNDDTDVGYSASGCFSGAASAKDGSALQAFSIRSNVGYTERSQPKRRALASWGTRHMSARVGLSLKQNLLRFEDDTTICSRADRPRSIQCRAQRFRSSSDWCMLFLRWTSTLRF